MSFIRPFQISRAISRLFSLTSNTFSNRKTRSTATPTNPKKCKRKSPYMICQAEPDDFPKIMNIMEKNYFREEPVFKFLGLKLTPLLATRILDKLNEGSSLVARCKYTGRILGIALNSTSKPWNAKLLVKLAGKQVCPKTKKLLMFYSFLESAPRLFEKNTDVFEIFSTKDVFIERGERNYGLGQQLLNASVDQAIDRKYKLLRCNATHFAFSQLLEKMHFKLEMHVRYETYRDENGEYIFQNVEIPNVGVKIYTLDLTDRKKFSDK